MTGLSGWVTHPLAVLVCLVCGWVVCTYVARHEVRGLYGTHSLIDVVPTLVVRGSALTLLVLTLAAMLGGAL